MRPQPHREAGFTVVELLVAISIFAVLGSVLLTSVVAARNSVTSTQSFDDMTDQARATVDRVGRDLREAQTIDATYPASSDGHAGITFDADYDNDGTIEPAAPDPERLTYCYRGTQILIFAGAVNCDTSTGGEVVADHVTAFSLDYTSTYNANNTATETWSQLDAAGDNNGVLDAGEWSKIDVMTISLTITEGKHRASYSTTVNLRNQ